MNTASLESAFAAIGRAVCAYQAFERVIVLGVELVRIGHAVRQGVSPPDHMNANRFRVATKSLLKELAQREDIDPTLYVRIDSLVDQRHTLVHQWVSENGWPSGRNHEATERMRLYARQVEAESKALMFMLLTFVLRHAAKDPTDPKPVIEARAVLTRLFHEAHVENDG